MSEKRRRAARRGAPAYLGKLIAECEAGRIPTKPGAALAVSILHDDWCDLMNGRGVCNCEPEISTVSAGGAA